jgi:hypothetical protein
MTEILETPLAAHMAWRGADLQGSDDWIDVIRPAEQAELRASAAQLPDDPARWTAFGRDELPLPALGPRIARMACELEDGRGFVLIRGLDVDMPETEIRRWYWVLGRHFGRMVAQNARGDLIGEVADRGGRYGADPHARGYTSNAEMRFHSDVADVVTLLCVRPAKSGGESSIVSTMTIYNHLLEEAPQILKTLYRGFRYYVRLAETGDGAEAKGRVATVRDAMYVYCDGRLTGGINPQSIRSLPQVTGEGLPDDELQALDIVEELAERRGLALTLKMRAGDLLLVSNHMVLHKRTAFTDFEDPAAKRLLLRFWLNLHNGRRLPADCAKAINRNGFDPPTAASKKAPVRV